MKIEGERRKREEKGQTFRKRTKMGEGEHKKGQKEKQREKGEKGEKGGEKKRGKKEKREKR